MLFGQKLDDSGHSISFLGDFFLGPQSCLLQHSMHDNKSAIVIEYIIFQLAAVLHISSSVMTYSAAHTLPTTTICQKLCKVSNVQPAQEYSGTLSITATFYILCNFSSIMATSLLSSLQPIAPVCSWT